MSILDRAWQLNVLVLTVASITTHYQTHSQIHYFCFSTQKSILYQLYFFPFLISLQVSGYKDEDLLSALQALKNIWRIKEQNKTETKQMNKTLQEKISIHYDQV